tara:strand:- start:3427 stop:4350 length:924 start_codon:yes stop_codon:yes gene_type:complete
MKLKKDFIHINDFSTDEILELIDLTIEIKSRFQKREEYYPFKGYTLAMIFSKPSARTRISFETGFSRMGGKAIYLGPEDIGIGKREAVKDIARVISSYNDIIMARLFDHAHILDLAKYASIPVINGLTDYNHPCQIMCDIFTIFEKKGDLDNLKIAYVGDGNNIVNSWLILAQRLSINFVCICPEGYEPNNELMEKVKFTGHSTFELSHDPIKGVEGADIIYTDVWASMGQKSEATAREKIFKEFQVNSKMISNTNKDTLFMHCLPAERGRETTDEVMESSRSIVFQQAENRMHMQNAIMLKICEKV